jgi:hypothetical protein
VLRRRTAWLSQATVLRCSPPCAASGACGAHNSGGRAEAQALVARGRSVHKAVRACGARSCTRPRGGECVGHTAVEGAAAARVCVRHSRHRRRCQALCAAARANPVCMRCIERERVRLRPHPYEPSPRPTVKGQLLHALRAIGPHPRQAPRGASRLLHALTLCSNTHTQMQTRRRWRRWRMRG